MKVNNMHWKVFYYDINAQKISTYDIFDHRCFRVDIEKKLNFCETKEQFAERLKANLMYYFWSKAEWEVVISAWVGGDASKKIDVYTQVMNNFDVFLDYVWSFKEDKE